MQVSHEDENKPWERLPDEPAVWFARFTEWLHQDLPRSVLKLYQQELARKGEKRREEKPVHQVKTFPSSWFEARTTYCWHERAAAWDAAEHARKERAWAIAREAEREAELELAKLLRAKAKEVLALRIVVADVPIDNAHIFKTAAALLGQAKNHARAALEMPDKFERQEVHAKAEEPVSPLMKLTPVERMDRIMAIARKIKPSNGAGEEEDMSA